jgi:hypothetical protein
MPEDSRNEAEPPFPWLTPGADSQELPGLFRRRGYTNGRGADRREYAVARKGLELSGARCSRISVSDGGVSIIPPTRSAAARRRGTARRASRSPAARTDHVGQGKCWLHGGRTPIKHGRYSKINRARIRELIAQHEADPDPLNVLPEIAALRALFQEFIERYDEHTEALLAWHASFQLTRRPLPEDLLASFERVVDEWENAPAKAPSSRQQEADLAQARKFVDAPAERHRRREAADGARSHRRVPRARCDRQDGRARREGAERERDQRPELNRVIHQLGHDVNMCIPDGVIPPTMTGEMIKAKIREGWLAVAV